MGMLRASSLVAVVSAAVLAAVLADWLWNDQTAQKVSLLAFLEEGPRGQKLDAQQQVILQGLEVSEKVLTDLIDGRLSLVEAAATLRTDCESRRYRLDQDPLCLNGVSAEEHFCRITLDWARIRLIAQHDPRRLEVVRHLDAELQAYLARRDCLAPARHPGETSEQCPAAAGTHPAQGAQPR
jgi:hypothetical protein